MNDGAEAARMGLVRHVGEPPEGVSSCVFQFICFFTSRRRVSDLIDIFSLLSLSRLHVPFFAVARHSSFSEAYL